MAILACSSASRCGVAGVSAVASIVAGDSALREVARVPAFAGAYWLTLRAELKLGAHDGVPKKISIQLG
jgi:hypothetical protein